MPSVRQKKRSRDSVMLTLAVLTQAIPVGTGERVLKDQVEGES
jgi:hypothetical protein